LVRTTGTQTPVRGEVDNRHLPANFTSQTNHVENTNYPAYDLTVEQVARIDQHKYYNAIKNNITEKYGTYRYAVNKSKHRLFIKDGNTELFACRLADHSIRCAYLELSSVDFNIIDFLQIAGKWSDSVCIIETPDHM
jgi:hypothetical protein